MSLTKTPGLRGASDSGNALLSPPRIAFAGVGLWNAVTAVLVTTLIAGTADAQQVPVEYRIKRIPVADGTGSHDVNNLSMVVGGHSPNGSSLRVGYIYDHLGIIGAPRTVHSLDEWIPNLDGWSGAVCTGINDAGQVVGILKDTVDNATVGKGFYLDLDIFSESPTPTWQYLPAPPDSTYFYGRRINNAGDVIVPFRQDDVNRAYLFNPANYNPNDPATDYEVLLDPATGSPLLLDSLSVTLNNSRQVVGQLGSYEGFRLTPGVALEIIPFSNHRSITINDSGTVAGTIRTEMPSDKGKKTRQVNVAARFDMQGNVQLLTDQASGSFDINQSGDVGIDVLNSLYLYHSNTNEEVGYGLLSLDDLVVGTEDDIAFWSEAISGIRAMNNRDETTGFGQIVVKSMVFSITGKGKQRAGTYEYRHFLLTPVPLP